MPVWTGLQLSDQWDIALKILGFVLTLSGAVFGFVKYQNEQKKNRETEANQREKDREVRGSELAWRRTQFIFELARTFEADPNVRSALEMVLVGKGIPTGSTIDRILGHNGAVLTPDERVARYAFDRYLEFFDRLHSYVVELNVLTPDDIASFGWYLRHVRDTPAFRSYAEANGYDDVLELADTVKKRARPEPEPALARSISVGR